MRRFSDSANPQHHPGQESSVNASDCHRGAKRERAGTLISPSPRGLDVEPHRVERNEDMTHVIFGTGSPAGNGAIGLE